MIFQEIVGIENLKDFMGIYEKFKLKIDKENNVLVSLLCNFLTQIGKNKDRKYCEEVVKEFCEKIGIKPKADKKKAAKFYKIFSKVTKSHIFKKLRQPEINLSR
jgi:hypothetical protein